MKRTFLLVVFALLASSALCQGTPNQSRAQDDGFMGWVHNAWKTVQEEGRPAAERLVKQFPKRFQDMKTTVAGLNKRAHDSIDAMDLEQKKNLLIEIWRVRKSLDLMTLLKPEVLQSLTGMDTSGLKALESQATKLSDFVTQKIHSARS
jgi:hypothetical protein